MKISHQDNWVGKGAFTQIFMNIVVPCPLLSQSSSNLFVRYDKRIGRREIRQCRVEFTRGRRGSRKAGRVGE